MSFSRWGEKRWLESIKRFKGEAGEPSRIARYPELARLTVDPDVNFLSRNVFSRTKPVVLRDGGIERTVLNATTDRPIDPKSAENVRADPLFRRLLLEPIPLSEIGPYEHPWRAADR